MTDSGGGSAADAGLDSVVQAVTGDRNGDLIGRLSRWRAESGLSQAQVARLMRTSQSAVARLESGRHDAQLSTLARYADALGVSLGFAEDTGAPPGTAVNAQRQQSVRHPPHPAEAQPPCPDEPEPGRTPDGSAPAINPETPETPETLETPETPVTSETPETPGESEEPHPDHVLTWRQRRVLQVIRESVRQRGYPPSMREIGEAVGLASTSSVSHQLSMLQRKGYLDRDISRPRSVGVRPPGPHSATSSEPEEPPAGSSGFEVPSLVPVYVPVAGRMAGGTLAPFGDSVRDVMPLPRQLVGDGALFAVEVTGDSMINAAISDGDLVVVQSGAETQDGDIVVSDIDGVPTVRTLKRSNGHVWLLPHHPLYALTEGDDARILGRVVSVLRKL